MNKWRGAVELCLKRVLVKKEGESWLEFVKVSLRRGFEVMRRGELGGVGKVSLRKVFVINNEVRVGVCEFALNLCAVWWQCFSKDDLLVSV